MKVLITGATGLIGMELVSLLQSRNIDMHYLSTSQMKLVNAPNYKGFYWNPKLNIIDSKALDGIDVIFHLAGATIAKRWTKGYKQEIIESRTKSTALLFETLKKHPHKVRLIVSASAIGIYKDSTSLIHDEQSMELDDGFLADVVREWEYAIDEFTNLGIKICKLRTGMVLSGNGGALSELARPIEWGFGAAIGSGKQVQSWIHVGDLAEMYLFAANNSLEGVYNAVAPHPVTNIELTQTIASIKRKPLFLPNAPRFILKALLGEMHQLLFLSQHVVPKKMIAAGFKFKFNTVREALSDILLK